MSNLERPRLRGRDHQLLVLLRIALGGFAFLILASALLSFVRLTQVQGAPVSLAVPMAVGALVGMAPFVLVLLLLRDPPSAPVLDAAAGMAAGSILFRILWWLAMGVLTRIDAFTTPAVVGRLALFTAAEAAIFVLAVQLRKPIAPATWGRVAAIGVGFALWEWASQTAVGLLYRFVY